MRRHAFIMKLRNGNEREYQKRHDEIWPELKEEISKAGVNDYSIFLDAETGTLFAVRRQEDDAAANDVRNNPIVRQWWNYMADIMETRSDNAPVEIPLKEVFHMD
jgi:L-rhamnose mutarotase